MQVTSKKWKAYLRLSTLGLEMGLALFLGFLFGRFVDTKLHTEPWFMLFFLGCGFAAGILSVVRNLRKIQRELANSHSEP